MSTTIRQWPALVGFLAITLAVQVIAGWWTSSSVSTWYTTLAKPAWKPPGWLFGPVWTLLYIGIAVAGWRVWRLRATRDVRAALTWFAIQYALNLAWSGLFFGLRNPMLGLIDIVLLLVSIAITIRLFIRVDRIAGLILVPYCLWVGFASALNFAIWRLNP